MINKKCITQFYYYFALFIEIQKRTHVGHQVM